jgi:D-glycero-D-manno-heptose 1,7-bisphosphate phosphatase
MQVVAIGWNGVLPAEGMEPVFFLDKLSELKGHVVQNHLEESFLFLVLSFYIQDRRPIPDGPFIHLRLLEGVDFETAPLVFDLGDRGQIQGVYATPPIQWADGYGFGGSLLIPGAWVLALDKAAFLNEGTFLRALVEAFPFQGCPTGGARIERGTQKLAPGWRPCVFLDRDGVLIKDTGYPHRVEELELLEGIMEVLHWAQGLGYDLWVVTNQAGIAKGRFTLTDYLVFEKALGERLLERGIRLSGQVYCPYDPTGSVPAYKKHSHRRKPGPGMVLSIMDRVPVDLGRSFMIGDKPTDQLNLLGIQTFFVEGAYPFVPGEGVPLAWDQLFCEVKRWESLL